MKIKQDKLLDEIKIKAKTAQSRAEIVLLTQRLLKEPAITEKYLLSDIIFINEALKQL